MVAQQILHSLELFLTFKIKTICFWGKKVLNFKSNSYQEQSQGTILIHSEMN